MNTVSFKTVARSALGLAILVGCIIDSGRILKYQGELQAKQEFQEKQQKNEASEESRTEQIQTESNLALNRAKSGCVLIVTTQNNKPVRFNENIRVFDPMTFPSDPKIKRFNIQGEPINGVQPMPRGITVCNSFGDTALVTDGGYITKIYRVEPNKLQEFRGYIK